MCECSTHLGMLLSLVLWMQSKVLPTRPWLPSLGGFPNIVFAKRTAMGNLLRAVHCFFKRVIAD